MKKSTGTMAEQLIQRTIDVIATKGLDKTTTKAIVGDSGINEVYIYRNFSDKEELLVKSFEKLDAELAERCTELMPLLIEGDTSVEQKARNYFTELWGFMMMRSERCLAYIRLYYSTYYRRHAIDVHKKHYAAIIEGFSNWFKEEANVWMLINHMLNVMLGFAVQVLDGAVPDDEDTREHVFRLIYLSIAPYLRKNEEN